MILHIFLQQFSLAPFFLVRTCNRKVIQERLQSTVPYKFSVDWNRYPALRTFFHICFTQAANCMPIFALINFCLWNLKTDWTSQLFRDIIIVLFLLSLWTKPDFKTRVFTNDSIWFLNNLNIHK